MATYQHYVPRFYLKGFLDPELESFNPPQRTLWVYRAGKRSRRCSMSRVGGEEGFYEHESGNHLDRRLTKEEHVWSRLLEQILKEGTLWGSDRKNFARFLGLMSTRGKYFFDMTTEVLRLTDSYIASRAHIPQEASALHERLMAGGVASQLSKKRTLEEMLETGEYISLLYEKLNWFIARTDGPDYFLTSDTPVSLTDPDGPITTEASYQFSSRTEFTFPLSRNQLLIGSSKTGALPSRMRGYEVRELNRRTIGRAYKAVFASVNSTELAGLIDKLIGTDKPVVDVDKLFRDLDEELRVERRVDSIDSLWNSWSED